MSQYNEFLDKSRKIAEKVKTIIQMIIGIAMVLLIGWQVYLYVYPIDNPSEIQRNLIQSTPLVVVGYCLSISVVIELAFMLFNDGPDEAIQPIILGLAASILIVISADHLAKWEISLSVVSFVLCIGFLFFVREKFDKVHKKKEKLNNVNVSVSVSVSDSSLEKRKNYTYNVSRVLLASGLIISFILVFSYDYYEFLLVSYNSNPGRCYNFLNCNIIWMFKLLMGLVGWMVYVLPLIAIILVKSLLREGVVFFLLKMEAAFVFVLSGAAIIYLYAESYPDNINAGIFGGELGRSLSNTFFGYMGSMLILIFLFFRSAQAVISAPPNSDVDFKNQFNRNYSIFGYFSDILSRSLQTGGGALGKANEWVNKTVDEHLIDKQEVMQGETLETGSADGTDANVHDLAEELCQPLSKSNVLVLPSLILLNPPLRERVVQSKEYLSNLSDKLVEILGHYGIHDVKVVAKDPGPVITRFELELLDGANASKISGLGGCPRTSQQAEVV